MEELMCLYTQNYNKGETKMPIMKKMRRINIIGAQRSIIAGPKI